MTQKPDPDKDNVALALSGFITNPVGYSTLIAVIVGGVSIYYSFTNEVKAIRQDLVVAVDRGAQRNAGQDGEINELKGRLAKTEGNFEALRRDLQDMRSDVREIATNIRWLARGQLPEAPGLDRKPNP